MTTALDVLHALRRVASAEASAAYVASRDRSSDLAHRSQAVGRKIAFQEIAARIDQLLPTVGEPAADEVPAP